MPNTLFYGDNLEVLQAHVADSSVDLVYLDPPFNSNRDYNVLFKEQSGSESAAQIKAFGDTWRWANAALDWENFPTLCPNPRVQDLMQGFVNMLGRNDVTAYLVMMAPRLYHLHRVLKPTGSLYLHCDPTASHYLKLLLDAIFGPRAFRNEIIWVRHEGHSDAKRFGTTHDVIFYYRKTPDALFNKIYTDYSPEQLKRYRPDENGRLYTGQDLTGAGVSANRSIEWRGISPGANRHWMWSIEEMERLLAAGKILLRADGKPRKDGYKVFLDEMPGKVVGDVWADVGRIPNTSSERLGYPTQKPLALLERIIGASSNPGDVVLDPFCGCGTAIVAAQALGRKWLGIDITPIATTLIQDRLKDKFQMRSQQVVKAGDADFARAFAVEGLPTDVAGAKMLYDKDPTHKDFEMWAVGLIPMLPQDKKGADGGIDGIKDYQVGDKKPIRAVAQVKGGKAGAPAVQQLRGAMEKFGATLGLFVTLEPPTKNMADEALAAGFYTLPLTGKQIPRVQIRTVGDLLDGRAFDVPSYAAPTQAVATAGDSIVQGGLEL